MRAIFALPLLMTITVLAAAVPAAAQNPVLPLTPDEQATIDAMLGPGVVGIPRGLVAHGRQA